MSSFLLRTFIRIGVHILKVIIRKGGKKFNQFNWYTFISKMCDWNCPIHTNHWEVINTLMVYKPECLNYIPQHFCVQHWEISLSTLSVVFSINNIHWWCPITTNNWKMSGIYIRNFFKVTSMVCKHKDLNWIWFDLFWNC